MNRTGIDTLTEGYELNDQGHPVPTEAEMDRVMRELDGPQGVQQYPYGMGF